MWITSVVDSVVNGCGSFVPMPWPSHSAFLTGCRKDVGEFYLLGIFVENKRCKGHVGRIFKGEEHMDCNAFSVEKLPFIAYVRNKSVYLHQWFVMCLWSLWWLALRTCTSFIISFTWAIAAKCGTANVRSGTDRGFLQSIAVVHRIVFYSRLIRLNVNCFNKKAGGKAFAIWS